MTTLYDFNSKVIGYFYPCGKIENSNYLTIGFIIGNQVQNSSYQLVGYIDGNRILNCSYKQLCLIESNKVIDESYRIRGYSAGGSASAVASAAVLYLL